jgi:Hypothetical glycosyl hydrolase 6
MHMTDALLNRQVHLDFHTGPDIPDVGVDFDENAFGETLAEARVNSITLFAKCHHGHLYYDTKRPERHPGLKPGLHLLERQIEACRRRGIRTPIYLSVMCDEYAANLHPDWVCRNPDGSPVGPKPFQAGWQILDMSSPYVDFLEEQIVEVVKKFKPVDGIFLDMCWDQLSVSKYAVAKMCERGLDPEKEADRSKHARQTVLDYMTRYNAVIEKVHGSLPRVWYNSRPKANLASEKQFLKHIEIEALPTGGWGYTYFPLNVRWARNFGLPFIGMTARFHKSWSDFGGYKPDAALKYEVSQMLAHGGGCSVGDQLHPRGRLDREAYRRIGRAYRHVQATEVFTTDAAPLTDVAVLRDPMGEYHLKPGGTLEGVVRLLQQLLVQFDLLPLDADLSRYPLTIVPEGIDLSGDVGRRLIEYMNAGGKVLIGGRTSLASAPVELRRRVGVADLAEGGSRTPFFRYDQSVVPKAEEADVVSYDGTLRLTPTDGATDKAIVPAVIVEAYFDRAWNHFCGHSHSPPASTTTRVPATLTSDGAAVGFDLFAAYATHGQSHVRELARTLIARLHPVPLVSGRIASHAEVTLTRQKNRTIVHVLSYAPQRRTPSLDLVEEATPLVDVTLNVRVGRTVASVTQHPVGKSLAFNVADGVMSFTFSSDQGHDVIVIE